MDAVLAAAMELQRAGLPFALATVVRCEKPTSARVGDRALVHGDGRLEGWVGGSCAQPVVVREGLRAIAEGQPRLIGLIGEGVAPERARRPGLTAYPMSCHSGGTLEIYIEPFLPQARIVLVGRTPIARALARLAGASELRVELLEDEAVPPELALDEHSYVVVAAQGDDAPWLRAALASAAPYVGLIASRRRAAALLGHLRDEGVAEAALRRFKAPAGLDIGASSPDEIAISVLAEIVQLRRRGRIEAAPPAAEAEPAQPGAPAIAVALDPVCGMEVPISAAQHVASHAGTTYYFCCPGCRGRFVRNPERFLAA